MKTSNLLGIGLLIFVAVAGWRIGDMLTPEHAVIMPAIVFFLMFAAAITALSMNRRVDVYYYLNTETQPQRLSVQPTRYTVVNDRPTLPTMTPKRIKVK